MAVSLSLSRIVDLVGPASVTGTGPATVAGIASLTEAGAEDLSFLGNAKYRGDVAGSKAGVILLPEDYAGEPSPGQCFVRLKNPSYALALVCGEIEKNLRPQTVPGIHRSAVISPEATLGRDVHVGPLAVIESGANIGDGVTLDARTYVGHGAKIGAGSTLKPGSFVGDRCVLGERVILQPGAVVGSDGFGYETIAGEHRRVPQVGVVVLGDDVEVGANATIDRARFGVTRIGRGTKIDNLVQIAHNVVVGDHCLVVAQAGIAGSTTLDDYVVLGGQVGLAGHIAVGKGAKIGAQAGVLGDVEPGAVLLDAPAIPFGLAKKLMVLKMRLPDLFKKVDSLEKQLAAISGDAASPR